MSTTRKGLKSNPKLTINLSNIFERGLPDNDLLKQAIGQEILDIIRDKTAKKVDKDGIPFQPAKYSKEYADSLEFKVFGKSKGEVNLKLTGDMLGLMDMVDDTRNTLTIGWTDSFQAKKASGHIVGANNLPVRDFFDLNDSDIQRIRDTFSSDVDSAINAERSESPQEKSGVSSNLLFEVLIRQAASQKKKQDSGFIIPLDSILLGDF